MTGVAVGIEVTGPLFDVCSFGPLLVRFGRLLLGDGRLPPRSSRPLIGFGLLDFSFDLSSLRHLTVLTGFDAAAFSLSLSATSHRHRRDDENDHHHNDHRYHNCNHEDLLVLCCSDERRLRFGFLLAWKMGPGHSGDLATH